MLLVHQREQLLRLVDRDQLEVHAEVAAARLRHLQPVEPLGRAGQHDAAGEMHAAGLAGDLLDLLVELDGVLLQLGDVGVAVDGVHAAGGMPGRAGGQFRALDQHDIASSPPWSGGRARWRRPRRRRSRPLSRGISSLVPSRWRACARGAITLDASSNSGGGHACFLDRAICCAGGRGERSSGGRRLGARRKPPDQPGAEQGDGLVSRSSGEVVR